MSDTELLFQQVKHCPDDIALLYAYADALLEEGRVERAEVVKELIEHSKDKGLLMFECDNLQKLHLLEYRLRIREIEVGDSIAYDQEGRAFPSHTEYAAGVAVWPEDWNSTIIVQRRETARWTWIKKVPEAK